MPDPRLLKVGDKIRILRVPNNDLRQREREIAANAELAGWTADTIERIIERHPIVTISRIDECGSVWYDVELVGSQVECEHHSLIIYDDDTWERIE